MYRYKEKPLPENADLQALVLTEQISRDYVEVLRTVIVPDIHSEHGLKLREIRVLMCQVAQSCTDLFETRLEEIQELDEMEDFILQGEYTLASLKALENRGRLILQLAKRTQKTSS